LPSMCPRRARMPNLSLPAAALEWGVSRRTAYRLAERGMIHVVRFGRRVTVPAEEVERVRQDGVPPTPPEPAELPRRGRSKAGTGKGRG
jgi:excisionase family DNA binding protein